MTQADLFQAETTWFHVFRNMIECGDVAKMGPHAFTVYCVIKAHTNFLTGHAFPALETIVTKSGISAAQVKRELNTLATYGYISKTKQGRNNVYTLRERIEIADESGRPTAVATWDYLPSGVQQAVADLKNVLVTGDFAGAKIIQIEQLNIQLNTGDAVNVQINEADLAKLAVKNPALYDKLLSIRDHSRERRSTRQDVEETLKK